MLVLSLFNRFKSSIEEKKQKKKLEEEQEYFSQTKSFNSKAENGVHLKNELKNKDNNKKG